MDILESRHLGILRDAFFNIISTFAFSMNKSSIGYTYVILKPETQTSRKGCLIVILALER